MKVLRYGRTWYLGNYESERLEIEKQFPDDVDERAAFVELRKRLILSRQALGREGAPTNARP